jgi:hypothetical protein
MFSIFKRKEDSPERAAKKMAIDETVQYAQQQADDLIREIRRRRERKLLNAALKDGTNGG